MNHGVLRGHMLRQDLYPDDPSLDASDHAPGPVTTYTLTPEEIESRYGPKGEIEMPKGAPFGDEVKAKASDMFRSGMSDQYIAHSLKISVPTANNWRQAYRAGTLIRTQRPKETDVPSIEVAEEKHAAAQDEARTVLAQQEAIDVALKVHADVVAEEQKLREEEAAETQREADGDPALPKTIGFATVAGAVSEDDFDDKRDKRAPADDAEIAARKAVSIAEGERQRALKEQTERWLEGFYRKMRDCAEEPAPLITRREALLLAQSASAVRATKGIADFARHTACALELANVAQLIAERVLLGDEV